MDIERIRVTGLDGPLADALAALVRSAQAPVPVPQPSGASFLLARRHAEEPGFGLWVVRDGDVVVAYAELVEPTHEYTDTAFVAGAVHPDHQGRGIGRALLAEVSAATSRPRLRVRAWDGTAGEAALPRLGFERRLTHVVRGLDLTGPADHWSGLRPETAPGSAPYTLHRRVGPTPPDGLAEMVVLREAINDAPDATDHEAYPPERIAAYEQALVQRGQTQHTIVARHGATGEPAGLTMVCVDEHTPAIAHQEDTSVLRSHRGHRLGLRLKVEMALWLRQERPDVRSVQTWNDRTNHRMIRVNERLGATPVASSTVWVRHR